MSQSDSEEYLFTTSDDALAMRPLPRIASCEGTMDLYHDSVDNLPMKDLYTVPRNEPGSPCLSKCSGSTLISCQSDKIRSYFTEEMGAMEVRLQMAELRLQKITRARSAANSRSQSFDMGDKDSLTKSKINVELLFTDAAHLCFEGRRTFQSQNYMKCKVGKH